MDSVASPFTFDPTPETPRDAPGLTTEAIAAAARAILAQGRDAGAAGPDVVRHVSVCGGRVAIQLALQIAGAEELSAIDAAVAAGIRSLGASDVDVVVRRPESARSVARSAARDPWVDQVRLASVRHVVAVGAGKGGVGKSTVAVNLALALARGGLQAGLLDADIYGPSLPILLGIGDGASRVRLSPEKHILPLEAHGLPMISFGFFLGERSPAIWRGPMVSKAVKQFARGVAWPTLDVLVVDLPPGTGDVPLSLAQAVVLSGAVVVTQPSRVAAAEAQKAVDMFRTLEVPVLGIVENMSGPFGRGAGRTLAAALELPLLEELRFDELVVAEGDAGIPTMVGRPESATGAAFERVAQAIAGALGWRHMADAPAER